VWKQGDNSDIHHNYAELTEGFFDLGGNSSTDRANNVTVAYNVIVNTSGGVCLNTGSFNIGISNFNFENNTLVQTMTTGNGWRVFFCRNDFSPLIVRNNIFYSKVLQSARLRSLLYDYQRSMAGPLFALQVSFITVKWGATGANWEL
jgi:hypothetical protein